jgi:cytochrome P450
VTDRPMFDYDHHQELEGWDPDAAHARQRATCPVAFTEAHGGYWVVTAHDLVTTCARDTATYSSDHDLDGSRVGRVFAGIGIPAEPHHRSIPAEVDPPEFHEFRRLLQPWCTPASAEAWAPAARRWAGECIDRHVGSGRIDLVLDVANPVPAMVTLGLVGLPVEEWERYAGPLHTLVYTAPGSPEKLAAREAVGELREALRLAVVDRRRDPRDDLATAVAHADIGGAPISEADAVNVLFSLVSGGVDTTTALLANAFVWLHHNPAARRQLVEDRSRIPAAREEFLRAFSPAPATARTTTRATSLGDVPIEAGERVLLSWSAANRDPAVFGDPDEVELGRDAHRHVAFGSGPHRCIGAPYARSTFDATLDVVLDRIPEYVVDDGAARRYERVGAVNGWATIPASFAVR